MSTTPDKAVTVDSVIAEHAAKLQDIYDDQTAGDNTFIGVLAGFLSAALPYLHQTEDTQTAELRDESGKREALMEMVAQRDTQISETATWIDVVIARLTAVGGPDVTGAVATLQSLAASLRGEQS